MWQLAPEIRIEIEGPEITVGEKDRVRHAMWRAHEYSVKETPG
jgi:hypothetical protein